MFFFFLFCGELRDWVELNVVVCLLPMFHTSLHSKWQYKVANSSCYGVCSFIFHLPWYYNNYDCTVFILASKISNVKSCVRFSHTLVIRTAPFQKQPFHPILGLKNKTHVASLPLTFQTLCWGKGILAEYWTLCDWATLQVNLFNVYFLPLLASHCCTSYQLLVI